MRADWIKLSYSNRVFEWNSTGEYVLHVLIELLAKIVTNTLNDLCAKICSTEGEWNNVRESIKMVDWINRVE